MAHEILSQYSLTESILSELSPQDVLNLDSNSDLVELSSDQLTRYANIGPILIRDKTVVDELLSVGFKIYVMGTALPRPGGLKAFTTGQPGKTPAHILILIIPPPNGIRPSYADNPTRDPVLYCSEFLTDAMYIGDVISGAKRPRRPYDYYNRTRYAYSTISVFKRVTSADPSIACGKLGRWPHVKVTCAGARASRVIPVPRPSGPAPLPAISSFIGECVGGFPTKTTCVRLEPGARASNPCSVTVTWVDAEARSGCSVGFIIDGSEHYILEYGTTT